MNVSEYIMERIADEGVDTVFMVSGGGAMFLDEALGNNPRLKHVCNHHEQACAIAAEGYQRVTGKLGVCVLTTGGAGTNALTGICCSWHDSIPTLTICGQVKSTDLIGNTGLRQNGTQEADIVTIVKSVTKYATTVIDKNEIKYHLEKAIYLAKNGRPGPVLLDIPQDIQNAEYIEEKQKIFIPEQIPEYDNKLDEIYRMLKNAKRPVILQGQGIKLSNTEKFLLEICKKFHIPVVTTKNGYDDIPNDFEFFGGSVGINGQRSGNLTIQNADLIITLGSRLALVSVGYNTELFAPNAKKVLIDIDDAQLKYSHIKNDLLVKSDLKIFMPLFKEKLEKENFEYDYNPWVKKVQYYRTKYPIVTDKVAKQKRYVDSYYFFDRLSDFMQEDDVLVTDQGATFYSLTTAFKVKEKQHAFTNGGFCPMGYGLPASVGCAFAKGVNRVVSVNGDGGLQMNLQELQTIIHHNLNMKVFVFNNDGYLSIKHTQTNFFNGHLVGSDPKSGLSCPDSIKLGKAYGFKTYRIKNHKETDKIIKKAMETKGPVLVEVMIDPMQPYYPKVTSMRLADGSFKSQPLDNMWPFLSEEEMKENRCVE